MSEDKKKFVCPARFIQAFVYPDGRVFCCPDCMTLPEAQIGNLNEKSFGEIWFSQKAKDLRKAVNNGDYSMCFWADCFSKTNFHLDVMNVAISRGIQSVQNSFPKVVTFGIDFECNAACAMCRKGLYSSTEEELFEIKTKIDNVYLPILKDAMCVVFSTTSDPFASRANSYFIKRITEVYPDITFSLMTNGILCDELNCNRLGITDKLDCLTVSIHSATEETYNNVVKNGNYKKVLENLSWLKSMKENGKIKHFNLAFVVNSRNFRDIPLFTDFAKQFSANARFWHCASWGDNLDYPGENLQILDPNHPNHKEFIEIMTKTDFSDPACLLNARLKELANSLQG